jgi:excisionase family DNA binding protein
VSAPRNGSRGAGSLPSASPSNVVPLTFELELTPEQLDHLAALVAQKLGGAQPAGDGWLRGAQKIAEYLDSPVSRVYALTSAGRIPVERDGSSLIARRSDLDAWLREGGGRRP